MKKIILSLAGMCLFLAMVGCSCDNTSKEEIELIEDTTEVVEEDTIEIESFEIDTTVIVFE